MTLQKYLTFLPIDAIVNISIKNTKLSYIDAVYGLLYKDELDNYHVKNVIRKKNDFLKIDFYIEAA